MSKKITPKTHAGVSVNAFILACLQCEPDETIAMRPDGTRITAEEGIAIARNLDPKTRIYIQKPTIQ